MGGQKQITENILSMPCSSLSSNYPQHLPQTGGQEIAEQAVLWVMAGARALGEVLVAVYILRGRVCVKKLTHAVELAL